eukprot:1142592-Pelagomonas_calceolata.AAC.1
MVSNPPDPRWICYWLSPRLAVSSIGSEGLLNISLYMMPVLLWSQDLLPELQQLQLSSSYGVGNTSAIRLALAGRNMEVAVTSVSRMAKQIACCRARVMAFLSYMGWQMEIPVNLDESELCWAPKRGGQSSGSVGIGKERKTTLAKSGRVDQGKVTCPLQDRAPPHRPRGGPSTEIYSSKLASTMGPMARLSGRPCPASLRPTPKP